VSINAGLFTMMRNRHTKSDSFLISCFLISCFPDNQVWAGQGGRNEGRMGCGKGASERKGVAVWEEVITNLPDPRYLSLVIVFLVLIGITPPCQGSDDPCNTR